MSDLKRVGLLGGMSWTSTWIYYRLLNEMVKARLGGHTTAPVTIWSVEFGEIEALQREGDWPAQGEILARAARALQDAGSDAIALATNTLHLVADQITDAIDVPFVDMIDVVGKAASDRGHRRVGILATDYTMGSDLYPARLAPLGIDVVVPSDDDRRVVHNVIYDELVHNVVTDASRAAYLGVVDRLVGQGADGVLLACTEIGLLLRDGDAPVPLLDTSVLHCSALTDVICSEGEL
ncbi:MAG TPA: aspartate/glutamate racemase family protein [Jatrophihabitantaceae bacterium]|nr:aspartate/glutamate racemase family protein [Jatrophihabitantaceae bacterium]